MVGALSTEECCKHAERNMSFYKDKLILYISVMRSSKIRARKVATGLGNMKMG